MADRSESNTGLVRIALPCLLVHEYRNVCFIFGRKHWPKFSGCFLMTSDHDVSAWSGSQITYHSCFDIYSFLHDKII